MQKVELRGTYNNKPHPIAVDDNGYVKVNLVTALDSATDSVTSTIVPAATIGDGRTTVTPAYKVTQLNATPTSCQWVTIQASRTNTGFIAIGTSPGVNVTPGSSQGVVLESMDSYTMNGTLSEIYITATTPNDAVHYIYGV